jgi:hypothetical protein
VRSCCQASRVTCWLLSTSSWRCCTTACGS